MMSPNNLILSYPDEYSAGKLYPLTTNVSFLRIPCITEDVDSWGTFYYWLSIEDSAYNQMSWKMVSDLNHMNISPNSKQNPYPH